MFQRSFGESLEVWQHLCAFWHVHFLSDTEGGFWVFVLDWFRFSTVATVHQGFQWFLVMPFFDRLLFCLSRKFTQIKCQISTRKWYKVRQPNENRRGEGGSGIGRWTFKLNRATQWRISDVKPAMRNHLLESRVRWKVQARFGGGCTRLRKSKVMFGLLPKQQSFKGE